ncbi:unnamed protein product [Chrysodeixis includens]|uniref:Uncharacterized protein n=1 Tax=Chrysodeixis includens TaxID=689277 RepID=A0A9P0BUJ3_CHRIL|nr:unnamed protein product [Chrysodeixis includens]
MVSAVLGTAAAGGSQAVSAGHRTHGRTIHFRRAGPHRDHCTYQHYSFNQHIIQAGVCVGLADIRTPQLSAAIGEMNICCCRSTPTPAQLSNCQLQASRYMKLMVFFAFGGQATDHGSKLNIALLVLLYLNNRVYAGEECVASAVGVMSRDLALRENTARCLSHVAARVIHATKALHSAARICAPRRGFKMAAGPTPSTHSALSLAALTHTYSGIDSLAPSF